MSRRAAACSRHGPAPKPVAAASVAKPAEQTATPAPVEQAAALPAPEMTEGFRVGDTYDVQGRGTVGISGGWWGNTRVTLVIEQKNGENEFEGKLTGSGELNFWEECDIEVEGDKVTIRGTTSSVDNKPDVLRLMRVAPDRFEGRAQSGSFQGTATMTLKSRGAA